jgi:hypothetical protein
VSRPSVSVGFGVLVAVAAVAVRAQQPPSASAWAPALEAVVVPAGTNSVEPQLTGSGGRVILSWLELQGVHTTLKFAERTAYGWSDTRTVASGDDFMVNSADVPSVRLLADGTLAAHWLQQDGPDPESYKLRLARSKDAGRSWSAPMSPHHDTAQTQHGFASLFQAPGSGLGLVWLDGRAINPDAPEGAGNMALRASIFGADGRQQGETIVDARVCECCPTASAVTSEGVIVAYRNRSAGEIRDIYVTRLTAGRWTTPVAVYNDGWKITGCPVNGPAISARNRDVVVAWFNAKGNTGHAFVAFSHDAGRTFHPPVRIDEASALGRVGVELLPDGSAVATWVEFGNPNSQFRARRIDAAGTAGPAVRVADATGTRYPRVAQTPNELLFAWTDTENGVPRVRTARSALPPAGQSR